MKDVCRGFIAETPARHSQLNRAGRQSSKRIRRGNQRQPLCVTSAFSAAQRLERSQPLPFSLRYSVFNAALPLLVLTFILPLLSPAQDFWQQTNGPTGGTVLGLTTTAGGLVVAGTAGGGVFVSADDGVSWTRASEGLTNDHVQSIIATSGSILAGTWGGGVFRSTDNGGSWVQSGLNISVVRAFAYMWPGPVFAGTGTVHRSTNDGIEWEPTSYPLTTQVNALLAFTDVTILAGTQGDGIFKTTDAGDTWFASSNGLTNMAVRSLTTTPSGWMLAGTEGGIFRSTDGGGLWMPVGTGITDSVIFSLVLDENGLNYAGTESGKIFRSFNEGDTWDDVSFGIPATAVRTFTEGPLHSIIAGTAFAGIFRTRNDGEEWTAGNAGLLAMDVSALSGSLDESVYAGTWGNGFFVTTDFGDTWLAKNEGLGNIFVEAILVRPSGHIFAGTYGGVFRSTDGGETWHARNTGLSDSVVIALTQTSSGVLFAGAFFGAKDGIYKSVNEGETWTVANNGIPFNMVYSLHTDGLDRVLAGTTSGTYRSTDLGESWEFLGGNLVTFSIATNSFGHIYLGDEADFGVGRFYRSTDDGLTWDSFPIGNDAIIQDIKVDPANKVFAGTRDGLYESADLGDTWTKRETGMEGIGVWKLAFGPFDHVWAGALDNSVFRSTSPTSVLAEEPVIPFEFRLEQNYPNPFNAKSEIGMRIPEPSDVTLKIFDLLGREVATLVDERLAPGIYTRTWDATGRPSGVYYYRLEAGGFVQTKKLVLLR